MLTDGDRRRVIVGIAGASARQSLAKELSSTVRKLRPRWFVVRDAHEGDACFFLRPRDALCWLRGPMTRSDLRRLRARREPGASQTPPPPFR